MPRIDTRFGRLYRQNTARKMCLFDNLTNGHFAEGTICRKDMLFPQTKTPNNMNVKKKVYYDIMQ